MPADLLVGEDVIGVDFAAVLIDFLAVDARRAGAGFEMEADTGQVREFVGAPGAFGVFAGVDGGLEVLRDLISNPGLYVGRMTDHIQIVQVLEASLAAITVVGRVFFILVILEFPFGFEDVGAAIACEPVLALFMCKACLATMGRPSSVAPMAFDLVCVVSAVVEVIADAVGSKIAAATFRHDNDGRNDELSSHETDLLWLEYEGF
ncbi:MAG: hypothetical protein Q9177_003594 [Variospora cf. flavescens]